MKSQTCIVSLALLLVTIAPQGAFAMNNKLRAWLKEMAPQERMLQLCNMEVMGKLDADRLVDYTFADPQISDTKVNAQGAAYRRNGHWYKLSYSCNTSKDQMEVLKLTYKKGNEIPKGDWTQYNLFN
ncbi:DUF930 domain-containing protein [uncultured Cohaesibacter sp.]|uniref:DUF930 domain-containing protein n=1 Tax=uncultured Cohaesibacter sp. TaxID=1002546 RepID=UPI0029C707B6|nr:DUF930 domain-containing protein [uncultured Cohaesibacter sp.]